jgi:hypothetical protein
MSKSVLLISCCLFALLFLACGKPDETTNRGASNSSATSTQKPASTPVSTATASNSGPVTGVAECDSFIASYETCVTTKVPEAARAQYQTSLNTWRTEWKKLADNPQTKPSLAAMCKTQLEAAKTAFKSVGCTF